MKTLNYTLVDVFTTVPFGGNQLAVFQEEATLSADSMQVIANELNLSETSFILPANDPKKTKKIRIFTPKLELPMAGHPTIGAAYVLASKGILETKEGISEWIFEEGVGDIPITVHKEHENIIKVEMDQPLAVFGEKYLEIETVAKLLSLSIEDIDTTIPIQTVSSGVPFLFIPVRSLSAMKKINFRTDIWEEFFSSDPNIQHIFTFATETEEPQSTVHSRMFAPAMGIPEDPATGGASGPLGAYFVAHDVLPTADDGTYFIRSEQGFEMGRPSYVDITIKKEHGEIKQIKVGGQAKIIGSGQIFLDNH